MDEDRFERLLEAYGGDPARWPAAERALAMRYLAATSQAHRSRAEARRLDQVLAAWALDEASPALVARIAAARPQPRAATRLSRRQLWLSGAGLAAACAVGVIAGAGLGQAGLGGTPAHDQKGEAAVTAALDESYDLGPVLDDGRS